MIKKLLIILLVLVLLLSGGLYLWTHRYYEPEDFASLVPEESTLEDAYRIAWCKYVAMTSYGCYTYYPMRDGRWIVLRFYGPDHIFWKMEIMDHPV